MIPFVLPQEHTGMLVPCHNFCWATYYAEKMTISCLPPTETHQSPSVQDSAGNHYRSPPKITKGVNLRFVFIFCSQKWKKKRKTAVLIYRFLDISECQKKYIDG